MLPLRHSIDHPFTPKLIKMARVKRATLPAKRPHQGLKTGPQFQGSGSKVVLVTCQQAGDEGPVQCYRDRPAARKRDFRRSGCRIMRRTPEWPSATAA